MSEELHTLTTIAQLSRPIFGIPIFAGSMEQAQTTLQHWMEDTSGNTRVVVTPNPEQIMLARSNSQFLKCLQGADFALPDGIGVVVAGRLLSELSNESWRKQENNVLFPERLAGRIVFERLVRFASTKGMRVLLIGGYGLVAYQASERLQKLYPGLQIQSIAGPKDALHPTASEQKLVEEKIVTFQPQLVGVAFGAPKQEFWLMNHKNMLRKNGVKVAMAIGGTIDVLAGKLRPVPDFVERWHLEWFFRLLQEPSRWKRQLALPAFVLAVLRLRYFTKPA